MTQIIRTTFLLFFVLLFSCGQNKQDEKEINELVEKFMDVRLNSDGKKLYDLSSKNAINYYDQMIKNVLKGDLGDDILDKLQAVDIMMLYTDADLRALGTREFLIRSYSQPLDEAQKSYVSEMRLSKIEIDCNHAVGYTKFKVKLDFWNENGWKLDISGLIKSSRVAMDSMVRQSGLSENEFILMSIASDSTIALSSVRPMEEIYDALRKSR